MEEKTKQFFSVINDPQENFVRKDRRIYWLKYPIQRKKIDNNKDTMLSFDRIIRSDHKSTQVKKKFLR